MVKNGLFVGLKSKSQEKAFMDFWAQMVLVKQLQSDAFNIF